MRKLIRVLDTALAWVENSLIVAIVTVMVLMAFLQVVLRNLEMGLLWGDIFLRHLVLWVGFTGASLATRDDKHIRIDALKRITPIKLLPYIRIVIDMATIFVCIVLVRAGWMFLEYEIEAETVLFNDVPAWIFQIIIPIGFSMIAFRFFLKLVEGILDLIEGVEPEPPTITGH